MRAKKFKFIMASAKAKWAAFESYQQKFRSEWLLDKNIRNGLPGQLQGRLNVNGAELKYIPG